MTSAAVDNVHVMSAKEKGTGLPDQCCDAVYLRAVMHHIGDGRHSRRALSERFAPEDASGSSIRAGTLWFHGADHGVQTDAVVSVFRNTGLRLRDRDDEWGGGTFLLVFERER